MAQRMVTVHYIEARTRAQHNRARARFKGVPPSANGAMDEFLMSPQLAGPVLGAAKVIALNARTLAAVLLYSDERSHAYENSIEASMQEPVVVAGFPRVRAAVHAHGGYEHWSGPIGPETSHAAVVEFDVPSATGKFNPAAPRPMGGRRILGRAAAGFGLRPKGEPA